MLPLLYHAHTSLYMQDIPFWFELAHQHEGPILELGCGTGRVLLELAQLDKRVFGIDNNRDWLTFLASMIKTTQQTRVFVVQADITSIPFQGQFGLIALPCNTYSTLSRHQRGALLSQIWSQLKRNGVFAFGIPNPVVISSIAPHGESGIEDIFPHPRDGQPIQVSNWWQRSKHLLTFYWNYDHLLADGRVERYQLVDQQYVMKSSLYFKELEDSGLRILSTFGDYDKSPYKEDSPYLIVLTTTV